MRVTITLYVNYIIIIKICINNNIAVINNNYVTLQSLILLFKISMDMRNDFLEIYRQCGQATLKRLANPVNVWMSLFYNFLKMAAQCRNM
jgi:hypothetical protein